MKLSAARKEENFDDIAQMLSQVSEPGSVIRDWRNTVLDHLLVVAALVILPAVIQTVLQVFTEPYVPWPGAALLAVFYVILVYTTVRRDLNPNIRGWVIVALTYLTGVVALTRGGLAGDGRIYLMALPVIAVALINAKTGEYLAGLSIVTYIFFGFLAASGILPKFFIIPDNSAEPQQWLYSGLVMAALMTMTAYLTVRFSNFQVQTLLSVEKIAQALAEAYRQLETANQELEQKVQRRTQELSQANQHLAFLATHDGLTGLPNRALLYDRLQQTIKRSQRDDDQFALFFVDMDDFKHINDTFGHEGGDIALKSVAEHLRSCVRDSDTVARLGGDEFSILVNNVKSQEDVRIVAQKILAAFAQPIQVQQSHLALSASIGVSIYPEHGREAETLLRKADLAMYVVKGRAKNDFLFFDEQHKA